MCTNIWTHQIAIEQCAGHKTIHDNQSNIIQECLTNAPISKKRPQNEPWNHGQDHWHDWTTGRCIRMIARGQRRRCAIHRAPNAMIDDLSKVLGLGLNPVFNSFPRIWNMPPTEVSQRNTIPLCKVNKMNTKHKRLWLKKKSRLATLRLLFWKNSHYFVVFVQLYGIGNDYNCVRRLTKKNGGSISTKEAKSSHSFIHECSPLSNINPLQRTECNDWWFI
jgi:hypothetical protein